MSVINVTALGDQHVRALVGQTTAELLERAGWTPPPGVESVLERDEHGCPCDKVMWQERPETARVLGRTVPTCPVHGVNAERG
jgi:hypothetical protein